MPDALLDEVTALVEWPAVYAGTFDRAFLDVPQECLILTMQQNQKYFALADETGALRASLSSGQQPADRRIRPRSSMATNGCCARASPMPSSSTIRTAASRSRRGCRSSPASSITTSSAASWTASSASAPSPPRSLPALGADPALADRAAMLAKADLVTDMVGEFPELQGTMGRYYARNDGERPRSPTRSRSITGRASPVMRCRKRRSQPPSRWRTRSKPLSACSASATSRPVTRIRSGCAAPRWAYCASCWRAASRCASTISSLPGFAAFGGAHLDPRRARGSAHVRAGTICAPICANRATLRTRWNPSSPCGRYASTRFPARCLPSKHSWPCPKPSRSPGPTSASPTSSKKSGSRRGRCGRSRVAQRRRRARPLCRRADAAAGRARARWPRRLHRGVACPGVRTRAGGSLLRRRDGDGRRPRGAGQPAGAVARAWRRR